MARGKTIVLIFLKTVQAPKDTVWLGNALQVLESISKITDENPLHMTWSPICSVERTNVLNVRVMPFCDAVSEPICWTLSAKHLPEGTGASGVVVLSLTLIGMPL